jgi:3-dehydroquinate dehydratase-2
MRILILNGPNLNLLGRREPEIYGTESYATLLERIAEHCRTLGILHSVFQSNHEGALVDALQDAVGKYDGIVFNPAAYTHTSIAIADAVAAIGIPTVEVHLSDVSAREAFRQISYLRPHCIATVSGKGILGYLDALDLLVRHLT